jgi:hypothetical protein
LEFICGYQAGRGFLKSSDDGYLAVFAVLEFINDYDRISLSDPLVDLAFTEQCSSATAVLGVIISTRQLSESLSRERAPSAEQPPCEAV